MRRKNKSKKIILISSFILTFLLITGYSLFSTHLTVNTKGNYKDNKHWDFDYTGSEQVFTVKKNGKYQLEVWGAQGGYGKFGSGNKLGGYGAYSTGIINLSEDNKLYLNIGQKGQQYSGGYNGGGSGVFVNSSPEYSGGGGGATHIATQSGLLSTLESSNDAILIVAGAGGGGSTCSELNSNTTVTGGNGGGYIGNSNFSNSASGATQQATGKLLLTSFNFYGTNLTIKSANGSFGKGGDGYNTNMESCASMGGGGSGYYGGISTNRSGSGGSGYIGNTNLTEKHMTCYNCQTSDEENTKTISNTCSNETPTSDCSKIGNGFVRITYIK